MEEGTRNREPEAVSHKKCDIARFHFPLPIDSPNANRPFPNPTPPNACHSRQEHPRCQVSEQCQHVEGHEGLSSHHSDEGPCIRTEWPGSTTQHDHDQSKSPWNVTPEGAGGVYTQ
jgi:hypothetical protein